MGPRGRFYPYLYQVIDIGIGYITGLYLGRAPCTKETLPDFLKWRRVTRHPLVFRGLTGSQRTPGFWGVTMTMFYFDSLQDKPTKDFQEVINMYVSSFILA